MNTHVEYHNRPCIALLYAVLRGASVENDLVWVGGLKSTDSYRGPRKRAAARKNSR